MNNITYAGPFKDHIQNYVKLKQAIGYKFETDAGHLKRFDRFTLEKYPEVTALTKEVVLDWCSKKTYEAQANQCSRASNIRGFLHKPINVDSATNVHHGILLCR